MEGIFVRLLIAVFVLCGSAIAAPPQRIISTAPGITEILFALGLGDRLVGATEYCVYPAQARKIPRTGSWMSPNMEAILKARPDLVIVQRTAIHDSQKFKAMKLRTQEVQLLTVQDIFNTIRAIGEVAGVRPAATQLADKLQGELQQVKSKVAHLRRVPAMFIVGRSPGALEGMIAVGKRSYQSEVLELAGGTNIFADSPAPYPKVLHEEILSRNPEVIIDMGEHADAAALSDKQIRMEIALWRRFPNVKAVKNNRVYPISSGIYVVPGPRVADLARQFARMLHPEQFR
jgi:iron complex transport system substrate-binding protein